MRKHTTHGLLAALAALLLLAGCGSPRTLQRAAQGLPAPELLTLQAALEPEALPNFPLKFFGVSRSP